eukprot:TRINITY_DN11701_c0_g1_i1.p1 TRINITY_DN11701_c0_g1~~TRINITY_DN11701_c0_g1_i1.p1  ORF type:complete len:256 (+),score=49.21 TRINITY_DN11701_c0_g1_i1:82-849(+)
MRLRVTLSEKAGDDTSVRKFMWMVPKSCDVSVQKAVSLIANGFNHSVAALTVAGQRGFTDLLSDDDQLELFLDSNETSSGYLSPTDSLSGTESISSTCVKRKYLFHPLSSSDDGKQNTPEGTKKKEKKTKKKKEKKTKKPPKPEIPALAPTSSEPLSQTTVGKKVRNKRKRRKSTEISSQKDSTHVKRKQEDNIPSLGIPPSSYTSHPLSGDHLSSMILVAVTNLNSTLSQLTSELRLTRQSIQTNTTLSKTSGM